MPFAKKPGGFPDGTQLWDEDFEKSGIYHWTLRHDGYIERMTTFYDENKNRKVKRILLHREVAERMIGRILLRDEHIDHINHNKLDNRRENLRIVNRTQNVANRIGPNKGNPSDVCGVTWYKHTRKWYACMRIENHIFQLGYYKNIEDAISIAVEARLRWMPGFVFHDCIKAKVRGLPGWDGV